MGPRTGQDAFSEEETYLLDLPGTETSLPGLPAPWPSLSTLSDS